MHGNINVVIPNNRSLFAIRKLCGLGWSAYFHFCLKMGEDMVTLKHAK
jgi:hypothetical protein